VEEFKSLDLKKVKTDIFVEKDEDKFHSDFGDFSYLQDRLIRFGRSKNILILYALIMIGFVLTCMSTVMLLITDLKFTVGTNTENLNWIKIFLVIIWFIATMIPIALTLIIYGSKKLKVDQIVKGIRIFDNLLTIHFIILVILAIFFIFSSFGLLFAKFIVAVIITGILFGLFYLFFKLLRKAKDFAFDTTNEVSSSSSKSLTHMATESVRPYLIALLILNIISWLSNLGDNNVILEQLNLGVYNIFTSISILSNISFILGFVIYFYAINLTVKFDSFFETYKNYAPNSTITIPKKAQTSSKKSNQYDEDNWHL